MRQVPKKFSIFTLVMSVEFGNTLLQPLLAFVFFAANSPLFTSTASIAQRSLLFGLCLSLSKLGEVFANTVITTLSDHFGRKIALYGSLWGLLVLTLVGVGALALHSPPLLIGGMFLCNLLNTNKAVGPAIMSDMSAPSERVADMGTMQAVIAVGACLGPIIGGQLTNHTLFLQIAYSLPFMLAGIIAVLGLWLARHCPETLAVKREGGFSIKKILQDYRSLLQTNNIRWLFFLLILCQISWSTYYEFIPPALKNIFHYSPSQVGLFVGLIAFWLIVASSVVIRWLLSYFNYRQMLWISGVAIALGTLCNFIASAQAPQPWSHYLLWLSAIPIAMGDVVFFSLFTALLSTQVTAGQQGKAMGLTLIVALLVWSITALIGGYLLTLHPNGALLFAPCGAIGLLLTLFSITHRESLHDYLS